MKKFKRLVSITLICSMFLTGAISINTNALSGILKHKHEGILYITDKSNINGNVVTYHGKDTDNKDIIKNTTVNSIRSNSVSDSDVEDYTNVCVDSALFGNDKMKNTLRKSYENGGKIIVRKNDAKLKDTFRNLDIKNQDEYAESIDSSTDNKLKVVAVSVKKNDDGTLQTSVVRVQDSENQDEVDKAIAFSLDSKLENYISSEQTTKKSLISTNTVASALEPTWNVLNSNTWVDRWNSVTLNYGVNLEANPSGPQGGYCWYMNYTNVTVSPNTSQFWIGDAYYLCNGGGTDIVQDYGPTPTTGSTAYITLGTGGANLNYYMGTDMNISTSGMTGSTYTQWLFKPVNSIGWSTITNSQCYEKLCTVYKHPVSGPYNFPTGGLNINFNYSVYTYIYIGSGKCSYYGLASSSVRTVSSWRSV